jgi:hypothetical protein
MRNVKYIQPIKAALLLIIFSLNTIIGFACAAGMSMGFNAHHHEEEFAHHAIQSDHDETSSDEVQHHHQSKAGKDNCCNDKVVKFTQIDKSVPQTFNVGLSPVFFTAFISSFYTIDIDPASGAIPDIRFFLRSYHPPIPDIRIAIQSFQI